MKLRTVKSSDDRQTVRGTAKKFFRPPKLCSKFRGNWQHLRTVKSSDDRQGNSKKIFSSWQLTTFFHSKLKLRTVKSSDDRQTGAMLESNFFFCYIHFPDRQERYVAHKRTALTTFFFHRVTTDIQEQCGEEQKIFVVATDNIFFHRATTDRQCGEQQKNFFVVATDNISFFHSKLKLRTGQNFSEDLQQLLIVVAVM